MAKGSNKNIKTDSRVLSDGNLKKFLLGNSEQRNAIIEYVDKRLNNGSKSIALCFRGNYFCLYYRCHKLLDVKFNNGKLLANFDFSHAKFIRSDKIFNQIVKVLKNKYRVEGIKDDCSGPIKNTITFDLLKTSGDDIKKILHVYTYVTDQFVVRPGGIEYRFGRKENTKGNSRSSKNTEKDRQQALYSQNFCSEDKFIYDVEYVEPDRRNKHVDGRFDLLGLVRKGDKYFLELIELKSEYRACFDDKTADVKKHLKDYKEYLSNGELVNNRIDEAYEILELMRALFPEKVRFKLEDRPTARVRFIFSDDVVGCVHKQEDGTVTLKDDRKHKKSKIIETIPLNVQVSIINKTGGEESYTQQ